MLFLTLVFFLFFMRLGFWQIQRADEKTEMIAAQKVQEKQDAVVWTPTKNLPLQYERVEVKGKYLPQVFFLDNQHQKHQFGYNVLSPLALSDGSIILIDRGWVPGELTRRVLPNIKSPSGVLELEGSAYFPSKKQWVLGPAFEEKGVNVTIIERIDDQLISKILQKSVSPFIIRLDKQDSNGFVREWETVSMPPQRHLAYALQWFLMALVVLIIFVALNLKKKNEKTSQ